MSIAQWFYNKGYSVRTYQGRHRTMYYCTHVRTGKELIGTNLEEIQKYLMCDAVSTSLDTK
jgi:hypothetical protein